MSYRTLDPTLIIETARRLKERVAERFPESGLRKVSGELVGLAYDIEIAAAQLAKPIWWLRVIVAFVVLAGAAVFIFVGAILTLDTIPSGEDAVQSVQGIEASINTVLLSALGLLALIRLETTIKRQRVLRQLHGLRSMIHVIDMHQLTKDPGALMSSFTPTAHSPVRITNSGDLLRYLDYCSEMLSITGKLAALFAQSVNDEVVIEAVNDVESLGSNLSRKIWQKIMMLDTDRKAAG